MKGPLKSRLRTPTLGGNFDLPWWWSFAEACWQTKQSFLNSVCPAATCSRQDKCVTAPFIGPTCKASAMDLMSKGGHRARARDSSQISAWKGNTDPQVATNSCWLRGDRGKRGLVEGLSLKMVKLLQLLPNPGPPSCDNFRHACQVRRLLQEECDWDL